jgi:hypothetical protein
VIAKGALHAPPFLCLKTAQPAADTTQMAVAVRPTRRILPAVVAPSVRAAAAWPLVGGLVALNVAVRTVIGWLRETPIYLGDEYLYAELGRSIAETGRPLVRGAAADFPALLQPIVTAPAWLLEDVGTSYHLVQAMGALAMSLGAVPVFWLARRLGLGRYLALAVAALALAVPDLIYAGWVIAEPFAYPLALAAVATGVAAMTRPTRGSQVLFVALALLAAFARIQFVVLPACYLAAVVVVGLREGRLRAALREQALALSLLAVPVAVALALGPSRVLAFYGGVLETDVDLSGLAANSGRNLFVLLFASGFVLVPGALLGLGLALVRARTRAELAFAALTLALTVALVAEASLLGDAEQAQERYLFYVLPLMAVAFALYAARGWPYRLYHFLAAATLVTLAAVVPLSGLAAAEEKMHSPLLYGAFKIEQWAGSPGSGSLAIALAATLATAIVVLASRMPRAGTAVALSLALAVSVAFSAAAVVFDLENTRSARKSFFGSDPSWVDSAGLGEVTLLRNFGGQRGAAFQHLFWNRSVDRVALMPGASVIDPFPAPAVSVAPDGRLRAGGDDLDGALLVDQHLVTVRLSGARHVGSAPGFHLYEPTGIPRLSMLFVGRHHDGWLGAGGELTLWPQPGQARLAGTFVLDVSAPGGSDGSNVGFRLPTGDPVEVHVRAGETVRLRLPVCSHGPWTAGFQARVTGQVGARPVSVRTGRSALVPGADACSAKPSFDRREPGQAV